MIEHDIDATEAAVVAAMLASDKVPDKNQSGTCFSCDAPMKGLYCSECGQKNDNYRRSIFALILEAFGTILSLDSRIWRSWGALLFKPGKVPREYADGKRSHWSSPVRVYLAMSIILFGFMQVTNTHLVSLDVNPQIKEGVEKPYKDLTKEDITTKWQVRFFEQQKAINARNAERDMHLLELSLAGSSFNLGPKQTEAAQKAIDQAVVQMGDNPNPAAKAALEKVKTDMAAAAQKPDDPPAENPPGKKDYNGDPLKDSSVGYSISPDDLTNEKSAAFMVSFVKNPIVLTRSFNTWLPRLMFLMMPLTMLLGAFFIRDKKKALLFDHLVHAAYIHAFAFFLMFAGIWASRFVDGTTVIMVIFIILLVYLPLSLKRMFGRGWFKTLMTSYGVGFFYLVNITFALIAVIAWDISKVLTAA